MGKRIFAFFLSAAMIFLAGCSVTVERGASNSASFLKTTAPPNEETTEAFEEVKEKGFTYSIYDDRVEIAKYTGSARRLIIKEKYNKKAVTDIGTAFKSNQYIKTVYLNCKLDSLKERAFANCISLSRIYLPDGMESIGSMAFIGCSALRYVYVPSSVTYIAKDAFKYCTDLVLTGEEGSYAEEYVDGYMSIEFEKYVETDTR